MVRLKKSRLTHLSTARCKTSQIPVISESLSSLNFVARSNRRNMTKCALLLFLGQFLIPRLAVCFVPPQGREKDNVDHVGAYFVHKTVIIPHDQKKHRGGEDAAATSDTMLVVADGVGGWARHNVNPGLYSRLLTETIIELDSIARAKVNGEEQSLIELVHEANWIAASKHLGSATCTALKIVNNTSISTLNIGDSGYSIHRVVSNEKETDHDRRDKNVELLFASEAGQKQFNFPYQIGGQYGDVVADVAKLQTHDFQDGDIIVVFSDGVSDNLFPEEFHSCITTYLQPMNDEDDISGWSFTSYSVVADCIARSAYELGKDKTFDSPFAKGAREVGKTYRGGKHDDISVVVAQVYSGIKPKEGEDDPHYDESVYIYTGQVPPKDDLPLGVQRPVLQHTEF